MKYDSIGFGFATSCLYLHFAFTACLHTGIILAYFIFFLCAPFFPHFSPPLTHTQANIYQIIHRLFNGRPITDELLLRTTTLILTFLFLSFIFIVSVFCCLLLCSSFFAFYRARRCFLTQTLQSHNITRRLFNR